MRTGRTNGSISYEYVYNGSQLTQMTRNGVVVDFTYINGIPATISFNGNTFYYVVNGQGDITGIADGQGNILITYYYDAWGSPYCTYNSATSPHAQSLFDLNPFRYRGYVYDWEVGLYYLQSRYYIPDVARFLNADGLVSTGQGVLGNNMFVYCGNNPIVRIDSSGFCYGYPDDPNYDSQFSGVRYGVKCGLYGLHVRHAKETQLIDLTEKLNNAMRENAAILRDYLEDNGFEKAVLFFIEKVNTNGDWDFKNSMDWDLMPGMTYLYNGEEWRHDDIGNIHYGYVGSELFNLDMLLMGGGVVQIVSGSSKWEYWNSNFDDPQDQWAIEYGHILWDMEAIT